MKKKAISILLCAAMVSSMALAGCGGKEKQQASGGKNSDGTYEEFFPILRLMQGFPVRIYTISQIQSFIEVRQDLFMIGT